MELYLEWVHVVRSELILKQDGVLRLRIISGPPLIRDPSSMLDLVNLQFARNP